MKRETMRQILYESVRTTPDRRSEVHEILEQSRHNNALDGVTGLLWADGDRFMQIIEGPDDSVAAAYERIERDPRHHDLRLLIDRAVDTREFGAWSMALRTAGETRDEFDERIGQLVAPRSVAISDYFRALMAGPRDVRTA
jgi:hypothetical protein